jgi:hypothetical protein
MEMPEGWKKLERFNAENKRQMVYLIDPSTDEVLGYNQHITRVDIALQLLKELAEALPSIESLDSQDRDFEQTYNKIEAVRNKFKEWR